MSLSLIEYLLALAHNLLLVSWTGALIFYLTALYPTVSRFKEAERLSFNVSFFGHAKIFFRLVGIFTIVFGFMSYLYPVFDFSNFISFFRPDYLFLGVLSSILAYVVVGEFLIFPNMKKYTAIGRYSMENRLPQISPHSIVLEKRVTTFVLVQLIIVLMALVLISIP